MSILATDLTLPLKTATIARLRSHAQLTALVPASRIYAMQIPAKPTWPFIRYGSPITGAFEATCWPGIDTRITVHAFADTTTSYAGEDRALEIAAQIVEAMKELDPATFGIVENQWLQTRLIMEDQEAGRWHSVVEFNIIAVENR